MIHLGWRSTLRLDEVFLAVAGSHITAPPYHKEQCNDDHAHLHPPTPSAAHDVTLRRSLKRPLCTRPYP